METLNKATLDIKGSILSRLNALRVEEQQLEKELAAQSQQKIILWDQRPVSPAEFCNSRDFLGDTQGKIWPHVRSDMELVFSGVGPDGRIDYSAACNNIFDVEGLGSGKSVKMAIFTSYMAYWLHCMKNPYDYYDLFATGTNLVMMCLAPTEEKAKKIVYNKIYAMISSIPWFKDHNYQPDHRHKNQLLFYKAGFNVAKASKRELDNLTPYLNIRFGSGKAQAVVGEDLITSIVDEACSPGGFELRDGRDRCADIYETVDTRRISRFGEKGLNMFISSAGTEDRWLEKKIQKIEEWRVINGIPDSEPFTKGMVEGHTFYHARRASFDCNPKYKKSAKFQFRVEKTTSKGASIVHNLEIPEEFRSTLEVDPEKFLRDICAIPTMAHQPYFSAWSRVLQQVNETRVDPLPDNGEDSVLPVFTKTGGVTGAWDLLPPNFIGKPGTLYYVHCDLGTGGTRKSGRDAAGIAISHRGPDIIRGDISYPTVVVDLSIRFKASKKKIQIASGISKKKVDEIDISDVREFIIRLDKERGFSFAKITYDGFGSLETLQTFLKLGYEAERVSCTKDTWDNCRSLWYDGRIDIFHDEWLLYEMSKLEDKGLVVMHAVGAHDDEAQAMARSVEMAIEGYEPVTIKPRGRPRAAPLLSGARGAPSKQMPHIGKMRGGGYTPFIQH